MTAGSSWEALGPWFALIWAGLAAAAAAAFSAQARASAPADTGRTLRLALGAALAGFAASYLPYALSSGYIPEVAGLMSRTNGSGVWAGGLLLATLLMAVWRVWPRLAMAALAIMLWIFAWTDGYAMRQYQRSWVIQQDILAKAAPHAAGLPRNATVLLVNYIAYAGGIAVVFDAYWDFVSALMLATGRTDLSGTVFTTRIGFEETALVEYGSDPPRRIPYRNLFAYDHGQDIMIPVNGPPSEVRGRAPRWLNRERTRTKIIESPPSGD